MPLGLASRGYCGVIQHLNAGSAGSALPDAELESRLIELGFVEGARVEVIVVLPETPQPRRVSMLEFLESLPPGPRAFQTWEEYEQHLREEKDSWDP